MMPYKSCNYLREQRDHPQPNDRGPKLSKRAKGSSSTKDRSPATSKRKSGAVSESSSNDSLPLSKRIKKLSSINATNPTTCKRKLSEDSESSSAKLPKRTKRSSSTNNRHPATGRKTKVSKVSASSSVDLRRSKRIVSKRASSTTIHDIPDELWVEILCRLPCARSVLRCKLVSKSWFSLITDPNFIGRFLWLQRKNQTTIRGAIINKLGSELLTTNLFPNFRTFIIEKNLEVLTTCNDLVLCRSYGYEDDGQYYICNPKTMRSKDQLVTLPLTYHGGVAAVGFISEPYYRAEEDNITERKEEQEERKVIRINAEYKFKVVRILPPEDIGRPCFEFKIQIFSNDIGEWRESLVSCPGGFVYSKLSIDIFGSRSAFASNGILYWNTRDGDLLGLGPLMINNKSTITCPDQFHIIKLVDRPENEDEDDNVNLRSSSYYLQAHRGRLQLMRMVGNKGGNYGAKLFAWELEKEEQEQMALQGGGELGQKHRKIYSLLDGICCYSYLLGYSILEYICSDPDDSDTCFVTLYRSEELDNDDYTFLYKCNIQTRQISEIKIVETHAYDKAFRLMLPWWPTPVPSIRCSSSDLVK